MSQPALPFVEPTLTASLRRVLPVARVDLARPR